MNVVTLENAKLHFEELVEKVIADAEPTIVIAENGDQIVLLPLDEYNSWKVRLYPLAKPDTPEAKDSSR